MNRLERIVNGLPDDGVLSLYEEGSNMYFHGKSLEAKTTGALLLNAAVHVLCTRYSAVADLDLTKPFPLRNWMEGIPRKDKTG